MPPGSAVLDVGCEFGRIAGRCTSADITWRASTSRPRSCASQPGTALPLGGHARAHAGPYAAALSLFSTFGYSEDRAQALAALRAWHDVLAPGGMLLMELMHRDFIARAYGGEDDGPTSLGAIRENRETDWVAGRRRATVTYGIAKTFEVCLYTATELVRELEQVGFARVNAWGDLAATVPRRPRRGW